MTAPPRVEPSPWLWRRVVAHLWGGRARGDAASATMASYTVGAAVFIIGSSFLLNFTMHMGDRGSVELDSAELRTKAETVLDTILRGAGNPATWDEDPDAITRLGLVEAGSSIRLDPQKFEAIARGRYYDPSSTNGFVDYTEARTALGLAGYEFHLRSSPIFDDEDLDSYGVEGMDDYAVAYIGDYTGAVASAAAGAEAGVLDALDIDFTNTVRATVAGPGSVFADDSTTLRNVLVPLIGSGVPQSVIAQGSGTPKYDFIRVNATTLGTGTGPLHTSYNASLVSSALALHNGGFGYTKSREIRAILGSADLTGLASAAVTWNEYVDTDFGSGTTDDGDYGFLEVSPDGGATWYPISNSATLRSQDHGAFTQPAGAWRAKTATISAVECPACPGASSVQVALHWVADGDTKTGQGWIVDDVAIPTAGFLKTFEAPTFDLIIVGSNIDQNALTANEVKNAIRDYVELYGGRLVVLGGEQNVNWLQPLFHVGIRDGTGQGISTPDTTHPLLTVPNELDYSAYSTNDKEWDFSASADDDLFHMVVGTQTGHVLSSSTAGAFGATGQDGVIMLTTYLPYTMSFDQASRFLANTITYGRYHHLFADLGPSVPEGIPVASVTRSATMDRTTNGSGAYTELTFTLYVWRGESTQTGAAALPTAFAPRELAATASNAQATLTWMWPSYNGTSSITGYEIYRGTTLGQGTLRATVGATTFAYVDSGLSNGVTYWYNVTAVNGAGRGYTSQYANATPATLASAPGTPVVVPVGLANVLTWTAPTSNGGSAITNYTVYASQTSGAEIPVADAGNQLTYTHNVGSGETWYYRVSAWNAQGESTLSGRASGTVGNAPGLPSALAVTPGINQASLSWTAATGTVVGYHVFRGATAESMTLLANYTGTNTSFVDATISGGQTRYYAVRAWNDIGNGTTSNSLATTALSLPAAPTAVAATGAGLGGAGRIALTITAPVDLGGAAAVTSYKVYRSITSGGAQTLIASPAYSASPQTYTDTTATPGGATYYYRVAAVTSAEGAQSAETFAVSSLT